MIISYRYFDSFGCREGFSVDTVNRLLVNDANYHKLINSNYTDVLILRTTSAQAEALKQDYLTNLLFNEIA